MINKLSISTLMLMLFSMFATHAEEAKTEPAKKIRILGVGNSFTRNAQRYLPQIIKSDPEVDIDVAYAYIGGCPLSKHIAMIKLAEDKSSNPKAKGYDYYINNKNQGKKSIKEMLQDGKWDYVTIQQVSSKSWKKDTFFPDAQTLVDYIRKYQPDAKIIMHETWAYEKDSPRFKSWKIDQQTMYDKLHEAYMGAAKKLGIKTIPVGTAFHNARKLPLWQHNIPEGFNNKTAKKGDPIPDNETTLNCGYWWKKKKNGEDYLAGDPHHAGAKGEYLAGLVWYQFFTGKDARNVTYNLKDLSEERLKSLKSIAYETVTESLKEQQSK